MNSELKQTIKNEIAHIIEDIKYEELMFNKVFKSNVEFQRAYEKFDIIFDKYGKEAYLKYVPYKYKKQELKCLITEKRFLEICERYGFSTLQKIDYTTKITNMELHTTNRFKLFFIKLKKILSTKFISLPQKTVLSLPEGISNITTK